MKKCINSELAPKAIGPYSHANSLGPFLFISGQLPASPVNGEITVGDLKAQTHQVLKNLKNVLESAGSSLEKVLKTTVFIKDISKFNEFNEVYQTYFSTQFPARSTVEVAKLPKDAEVEIEAIAYLDHGVQ
ncbi:endoribonuclease L-PSP [Desulfotomaculum arcticum]|uniref:Endoribonuclease L-PSP n=1 Tax=Desulfotruncus arcticus DSM 17038 TaxID=1121424 RepID=A0A1I2WCM2_9FIRM|nr:RidA family protein [Desulfotruncus arcticus]SFG97926.1 endoribonuclease L-PSP [Desulfotomaculum arcticum] [Desulfotruncus arcticus DSM 17038]